MKIDICPYCLKKREISLIHKRETVSVRGEPIEYDAEVFQCLDCKREFTNTIVEQKNFDKIYGIYRKRHNLLTPEEIKKIREKYDLSQRALSRFLGWGEITIHRYEAGALQDKPHNEILVFLEDPENALSFFERNKGNLTTDLSKRLENRINELRAEKKVATPFVAEIQKKDFITLSYDAIISGYSLPTIESSFEISSFDIAGKFAGGTFVVQAKQSELITAEDRDIEPGGKYACAA